MYNPPIDKIATTEQNITKSNKAGQKAPEQNSTEEWREIVRNRAGQNRFYFCNIEMNISKKL